MKIVNEKGKLFGLINIVDLMVLIVALLLVAFVVVKFAVPVAKEVTKTEEIAEMKVTLRIRGVMDYMKEQIAAVEIGSQLVAGDEYVPDTKVKEIKVEDYWTSVNTDSGEIVKKKDEQRCDILVTISAKQDKNAPVYKIATQEVRTGRGFVFKTQTVEQNAIVEEIEFVNE